MKSMKISICSAIYSSLKTNFSEIPLIWHFLNFHQKNEIAFNFTKEIPLKMNRTKKKVHQKIEIAFNFLKENPFKIFWPSILKEKSL